MENKENDELDWVDLSKVTPEQAKKQFVDYRITVLHPGFGSPLCKYNEQYITECNGYSVPLQEVKEHISKKYELEDWQFNIKHAQHNIELAIVVPKLHTNEQSILEDMEHCGYFISHAYTKDLHGYTYVVCQYEPYYQPSVKNDILSMKIIIHLSPIYNHESIKEKGFIPQHKNKVLNYPDRIYFLKGNVTYHNIKELGTALYNADKKDNKNNTGEYMIYWLDTHKIPSNVDFYYDPNYKYGLFTYDKIPYSCVMSEMKINFNEM